MTSSVCYIILPIEMVSSFGVLEYWSAGVLEYWSVGKCKNPNFNLNKSLSLLHYSTTPLLQ
jgi:hypothetical protein